MSRGNRSVKESPNQRRARLEAERQRQAAAKRKRQSIIGALAVLGVIIIAAAIGIALQSSRSSSGPVTAPAHNLKSNGVNGVLVGNANAKVTVDLFEDFQCPNCRDFETATGPTVQKLVDAGKIRAVYHVLNFLDEGANNKNGKFSTRAGNLALCANSQGKFEQVHSVIYGNQPEEGTGGMSVSKLVQLARGAGVTDPKLESCVNNGTYTNYIRQVLDQASQKLGQIQTPTVLVGGKELARDAYTPQGLTAAVNAAAKV